MRSPSAMTTRYLYGDSTPFPLAENFLETAQAATELAVSLLAADEVAVDERRLVAETEARASGELAHLEKFARRVDDVYAYAMDELRAHTGAVAKSMVFEMRNEVLRWREATIAKALSTQAQSRVLPAIGRFYEKHQLPGTEWSLAWRAGLGKKESPVAVASARAPGGLDTSFVVSVPATHAWARPVRVATIDQGVTIHLLKKRFLRKPRVLPEPLDGLFITEFSNLPDDPALTMRKKSHKPSPGIVIELPCESRPVARATRIDAEGKPLGDPEPLRAEDTAVMRRLWLKVEATIKSLSGHRSRIKSAEFRGTPVGDVDRPEDIAKLVVSSIAPYVQEIGRRSSAQGELALKRTTGDGRREELFVPFATLLSGVDTLTDMHQALFESYELIEPTNVLRAVALPPPRLPPPMLPARGAKTVN